MIREWDHRYGERMKRIKQFDIEYAATKKPPVFFKPRGLICGGIKATTVFYNNSI